MEIKEAVKATSDYLGGQEKPKKLGAGEHLLARIEKKKPRLVPVVKRPKLSKKTKKRLILAAVFLVLAMSLPFLAKNLQTMMNGEKPLPSPMARPTNTPTIASPSAYASDSAVLTIEADLVEIEKLLKETRFQDSSLLLPEVDMDVWLDVEE